MGYLEAYRQISQRAQSIVHILMTSGFTMAYGVATEVRDLTRERLRKTTIEAVDSQTVESHELLIALEAARSAQQGRSLDWAI